MGKVRTWAGLHVHAAKVLACVVDGQSGEMTVSRLPGDTSTVLARHPAALPSAFCSSLPGPVRVAYEAGPTGYGWRGRWWRRSRVWSGRRARSSVRRSGVALSPPARLGTTLAWRHDGARRVWIELQ